MDGQKRKRSGRPWQSALVDMKVPLPNRITATAFATAYSPLGQRRGSVKVTAAADEHDERDRKYARLQVHQSAPAGLFRADVEQRIESAARRCGFKLPRDQKFVVSFRGLKRIRPRPVHKGLKTPSTRRRVGNVDASGSRSIQL